MNSSSRRETILLLLVLAAQAAVSFALRDRYNFLDEAGYLENGRLLLEGTLPYIHYRDPHMPGIMGITAAFFWLFGTSLATARVLMLLVNCASTLSAYLAFRRLDRPGVGLCAAGLLAIFNLSGSYRSFLLLIEPFQALIAIWIFALALSYREGGKRRDLVGAGLLFGLSLVFKQSYIFLGLTLPIYLWHLAREKGWGSRRVLWDSLSFLAAGALPGLLVIAGFCAAGHGYAFLNDTILFHLFGAGWGAARGFMLIHHPWRHLLPWLALPLFAIHDRGLPRPVRTLLRVFIFAGAMAAFPRFEYFHLVPALPFLGFIIARLVLTDEASSLPRGGTAFQATAAAAVIIAIAVLGGRGDPEFRRGFDRQREVAAYVKAHTPPGGSLFVFPAMPSIQFYSGLLSAVRNIDVEPPTALPEDQRQIIAELERSRPAYVVYLEGTRIDDRPVEEWASQIVDYIQGHYRVELLDEQIFPGYCTRALIMRRIDAAAPPRGRQ